MGPEQEPPVAASPVPASPDGVTPEAAAPSRLRQQALTIAVALGVLAAIATGLWGVPAAGQAIDGCTNQDLAVGIVKAKGCWKISGTKYTTTRPVDMNGFTVTPSESAPFTIDTDVQNRVATTNGKPVGLEAKPVKYKNMPLNFRIPNSGDVRIGGAELVPGGNLAGFNVIANAQTQISLTDGRGAVDLPLEFFTFLTVIGKNQSVTVHSVVAPGQGLKYDGIDIDVNGLVAKPVPFGIENFHAQYSLSQNSWGGSATVVFPGAKERGATASLNIVGGKLQALRLGAVGLNVPLGSTGANLQRVAGGFTLDPISVSLSVGASLGPEYKILGRDVSAASVDGTLTVKQTVGTSPGFVGLTGNVALVGIPVADGGVHVYFNGVVDFGARVGIGLPSFNNDPRQPFFLGGGVNGWFASTGFNVSGNVSLRLFSRNVAGAKAVISNRGVGACAKIIWSIGFGYSFQTRTAKPYFAGCDLGPYTNWNRPATRLARRPTGRVHAHLGQKSRVLRITGRNEVPGFTLAGGGGEGDRGSGSGGDEETTIEHSATDEDGQIVEDSYAVIPNETANEAIVILGDPQGEWTLEEHPGTEIESVERATKLPKERVDAEVRGHGRHRTLVWDARDLPRQRLQFSERVSKGVIEPILHTGKGSGRYRFTPKQDGFYGNRKLEVQVLQQETPRAEHVVDNYRVTKPPVPRRPGNLRVKVNRRGHDVRVHWDRSPGTSSYAVFLESADGDLRYSKVLGNGRHRASFRDTPLADHMAVKVFALNRDEDHGRPAKRRFDVPS